jgi:small subunit ribosomal protein S21
MRNQYDNRICRGVTVIVKEGEHIEKALRKFKNKISDSKLLETLREREHYTKPSEARKKAKSAARARWKKKIKDQQLPPKLF